MRGPTVDLFDVEGVGVEFVLQDQLLQIIKRLLVGSLSNRHTFQPWQDRH